MNNMIISSLTLFLVFVTVTPGSVSSVRIMIKKFEMEGWVLKSANISCLAEDIGHHVKQIVSIQLSGPGNVAIASLNYNSTVTLDKDLYFSKIEAEGNIHKETWKSHLTIVMTDILSSQTGMYTCEIHYFDQEGFIRDDITSNILDAGEQDTSQVLLYMSSRISTLEDRNADRLHEEANKELQKNDETQSQAIKDLQEAVKAQSKVNEDLQEAVKTQSHVIKDLQEAVKTQRKVNEDLQEKDRLHEEVNKELQKTDETQSQAIKDLQKAVKAQSKVNEDLQEAVKTQRKVNEDLQEAVKKQRKVNEDLQVAVKIQSKVNEDLQEAVKTQRKVNEDLQEKGQLQEEVIKDLQEGVRTQHEINKDLQEGVRTQHEINKDLKEGVRTQHEINKDLQEGVRTQHEINKDLQEGVRTQHGIIKDLKEGVRTQHEINKDLQEKDKPCGFSARYDVVDKMEKNKVLVFRNVDINIGDGYNPTTGMFTAPRTGMYAFHLSIFNNLLRQHVQVDIYANDQIVGGVFAKDEDTLDQSSVSVAVRLLKAQTVWPVVSHTNYNFLDGSSHYSVFSGYLVQAI